MNEIIFYQKCDHEIIKKKFDSIIDRITHGSKMYLNSTAEFLIISATCQDDVFSRMKCKS